MKKKISFIIVLLLILTLFLNSKSKKSLIMKKYSERIPIFTFHRLVPDDVKKNLYQNNQWVGSINNFEEMIQYLYDNGYKTISTEELYKWYTREVEFSEKSVLITIDDGFYEDYYFVYPIIKKYNYKATSFVVGSRIKNKTASYNEYKTSFVGLDVINQVRKEYPDYEFQSHSYNMHYYTLTKSGKKNYRINSLSYEELKGDILKNEKYGFTTMAYPYGIYNKEIQEILENNGYLISFKFDNQKYSTRNDERFAIPRIKLDADANIETLKKWLYLIK